MAIALPDAVKAELEQVQRELRRLLPPSSASWTRLNNLHLTLRFVGDVDASCVGEMGQSMRAAVTGSGELDLHCEQLGCFPDLRSPRVVWAGVHDAQERLAVLVRRLSAAVAPFAERLAESPFTGHITLARPKHLGRQDAARLARFVVGASGRRFGSWRAREVELIRSELSNTGNRYTILEKCSLV